MGVRDVRVRKVSWSCIVKPGAPVRVPRYAGTALRLRSAVASALARDKASPSLLSVSLPGPGVPDGKSLALARLRPAALGRPPRIRLKALIGCGEGASLLAEGAPVYVVGRLEGALAPLAETVEAPAAASVAVERAETVKAPAAASVAPVEDAAKQVDEAYAVTRPVPKAQGQKRPQGLARPSSEEEYVDWLEDFIRREGRTSLSRLGDMVLRPKGARPGNLKQTLMKHRVRFLVDLQNCVDLNRARRWRWRSQPMVTKVQRNDSAEVARWAWRRRTLRR